MNILFIGGIILVTLTPLLKKIGRSVVGSKSRLYWDEAARIERHIQQAKDKTLGMYPGSDGNVVTHRATPFIHDATAR